MDALDALPVKQLASALKTRLEFTLYNGLCVRPDLQVPVHPPVDRLDVETITDFLCQACVSAAPYRIVS